ncbi:glycoside hydrolase family 97 catalytic domain-containing protein [Bacillus gobiensis]|uniref:glycoside hydrolase family 97 protein n=1 Tax=Bacillus gobiensis TaxID=1441095 RepID=UPI003D25EF75
MMKSFDFRTNRYQKLIVSVTLLLFLLVLMTLGANNTFADEQKNQLEVKSPDSKINVQVGLGEKGRPFYQVKFNNKNLIDPSQLGFDLKDVPDLKENFEIVGTEVKTENGKWKPVWDEKEEITNHYNELRVKLKEKAAPHRDLHVEFRVFNDGVGFRYVFPEQENLKKFDIMNEDTEFRFADNFKSWWTPQDFELYEHLYKETTLDKMKAANTPITMKADKNAYLALNEADLVDYGEMTIEPIKDVKYGFKSAIVPLPDGVKAKVEAPHKTPWRTIMIGDKAGDLIESDMMLNLNEPNKIKDTSWIKPQKYMGIWWEMHKMQSTWAPGDKVGATTENAKKYIDFASEHNITSVLAEGWNDGWDGPIPEGWSDQNYIKSNSRFNLEEVVKYGKKKGVDFVAHNETGGNITNYENQLEKTFAYYKELGIHSIKTGYVGTPKIVEPEGHHHRDQFMVNHFRKVLTTAAKYDLMVDAHETIKDTGERRTYPNMMSRETFRGMEYNGGDTGNPAEHTVTLPFTAGLGGPMDYNGGIFNLKYDPNDQDTRVWTTRARQLAYYPVIFSGLQMAPDLPEHYRNQPEFKFIEDVPASWDDTKVLDAEIDEYLSIARKKGDKWFVGTLTDRDPKNIQVPLKFLEKDQKYVATIYSDGSEADMENNPTEVSIDKVIVDSKDKITASMVGSGGHAISLEPATKKDLKNYPDYKSKTIGYGKLKAPKKVKAGQSVSVRLDAENNSQMPLGDELKLKVDDTITKQHYIRIAPGEKKQQTFTVHFDKAGEYNLSINGTSKQTKIIVEE